MDEALKEKIKEDLKEGKKVEVEFIELVERYGYHCLASTNKQDMSEHWDVRMIKNPLDLRIDVKKEKQATFDYDCTWLEIQNVRGETGWLYAETLDAVAFKRKGLFHIVPTKALRKLVEEKATNKFVFIKNEDYYDDLIYNKYVRRNDVMVLTPFSDILPHSIMSFKID